MRSYLLYSDTDRLGEDPYFDGKSIVGDLGLKALFLAAAKEVIYENGNVKCVSKEDLYIQDTMRKVVLIPLKSEEQIRYRQEILKDCLQNEELIRFLYRNSGKVLTEWNKLGRGIGDMLNNNNTASKLMDNIHLIHLFWSSLHEMREQVSGYLDKLQSPGMKSFAQRLLTEFNPEKEEYIRKLLSDISFYTGGAAQPDGDDFPEQVVKPRIVMECGIENGLKLSSVRLYEVSSQVRKFVKPGSMKDKFQELKNKQIPDSFSTMKDAAIREQTEELEYVIVHYLVSSLNTFTEDFGSFFDSLHQQSAFYVGAVNLKHQMGRFKLNYCFPRVCKADRLVFEELKEFVMCLEQRVEAVGNTCSMDKKMLLIVTGANQGGKSTFLRSVGIAQVMMQCGLMVSADRYESGIFPRLFTHFTRREDSEMNSGRLDEELKRMNQIVENIGEGSLLLLNESFATTTEKEGSVIAYDIIKALGEAGVKILTVTHLLTFARRMYSQCCENPDSGVEFLSAERLQNGTRTFKMIQHAPEMTSFGLDLYEELVGPID